MPSSPSGADVGRVNARQAGTGPTHQAPPPAPPALPASTSTTEAAASTSTEGSNDDLTRMLSGALERMDAVLQMNTLLFVNQMRIDAEIQKINAAKRKIVDNTRARIHNSLVPEGDRWFEVTSNLRDGPPPYPIKSEYHLLTMSHGQLRALFQYYYGTDVEMDHLTYRAYIRDAIGCRPHRCNSRAHGGSGSPQHRVVSGASSSTHRSAARVDWETTFSPVINGANLWKTPASNPLPRAVLESFGTNPSGSVLNRLMSEALASAGVDVPIQEPETAYTSTRSVSDTSVANSFTSAEPQTPPADGDDSFGEIMMEEDEPTMDMEEMSMGMGMDEVDEPGSPHMTAELSFTSSAADPISPSPLNRSPTKRVVSGSPTKRVISGTHPRLPSHKSPFSARRRTSGANFVSAPSHPYSAYSPTNSPRRRRQERIVSGASMLSVASGTSSAPSSLTEIAPVPPPPLRERPRSVAIDQLDDLLSHELEWEDGEVSFGTNPGTPARAPPAPAPVVAAPHEVVHIEASTPRTVTPPPAESTAVTATPVPAPATRQPIPDPPTPAPPAASTSAPASTNCVSSFVPGPSTLGLATRIPSLLSRPAPSFPQRSGMSVAERLAASFAASKAAKAAAEAAEGSSAPVAPAIPVSTPTSAPMNITPTPASHVPVSTASLETQQTQKETPASTQATPASDAHVALPATPQMEAFASRSRTLPPLPSPVKRVEHTPEPAQYEAPLTHETGADTSIEESDAWLYASTVRSVSTASTDSILLPPAPPFAAGAIPSRSLSNSVNSVKSVHSVHSVSSQYSDTFLLLGNNSVDHPGSAPASPRSLRAGTPGSPALSIGKPLPAPPGTPGRQANVPRVSTPDMSGDFTDWGSLLESANVNTGSTSPMKRYSAPPNAISTPPQKRYSVPPPRDSTPPPKLSTSTSSTGSFSLRPNSVLAASTARPGVVLTRPPQSGSANRPPAATRQMSSASIRAVATAQAHGAGAGARPPPQPQMAPKTPTKLAQSTSASAPDAPSPPLVVPTLPASPAAAASPRLSDSLKRPLPATPPAPHANVSPLPGSPLASVSMNNTGTGASAGASGLTRSPAMSLHASASRHTPGTASPTKMGPSPQRFTPSHSPSTSTSTSTSTSNTAGRRNMQSPFTNAGVRKFTPTVYSTAEAPPPTCFAPSLTGHVSSQKRAATADASEGQGNKRRAEYSTILDFWKHTDSV